MLDPLYQYLFLRKKVSIPGVGSLAVKNAAARFDETSGTLVPSVPYIVFEQGTALTDKNFYYFVSHHAGLSEVDAVRKYQDFSYQLKKDIQNNEQVELPGLGIFKKDPSGRIGFGPLIDASLYFQPLTPLALGKKPEIEREEAHGIEVYDESGTVPKDRWWVWALVLTIIAIGAIVYYYYQQPF